MKTIEIYNSIYEDIFCNTFNKSCYVFLCGGSGKEHIRNSIRPILEHEQFQVLYPEDLFMEMLNRDKKADLLEYENLLADNSDIICIICESIGSAVELGAFVQNENIKNKMIVAINQKYARQKSFVMMGPVKHLQKVNNNKVVQFKNDEPEALGKELIRVFRQTNKRLTSNKNQSFSTLSAYIAFIPMIVYFYQIISRKEIHRSLKGYLKSKNILPANYNELFNASIKYLLKSGVLVTEFNLQAKDETFSLSKKGNAETYNLIARSSASNRTLLHDKIRCVILKKQLNN